MNEFIITPLAGAVIGFFTNWLAIKMLFRPHTPKYIFGVRLPFTPGLIPKERFRLSKKIGETLAKHIVTNDLIISRVLSPENLREMEAGLHEFLLKAKEPATKIITERLLAARERVAEDERGVLSYLPENTMQTVENALYESIPYLIGFMRELPPDIESKLIDLTGKIIDEAVGRFMSAFISSEKALSGIINSLCDYLEQQDNRADTAKQLSKRLEGFLTNDARKISWNMELVSEMTSRVIDTIFEMVSNQLFKSEVLNSGLARALTSAFANIDLAKIAEDQMNMLDMLEAEKIVLSVVNRELHAITIVGGVLGFIIGLIPGIWRLLT